MTAQRYLARTQQEVAVATERLSSGQRINSARDDAAGIAVADRLGVRASGMGIGLRNVNEGVSVLQVTETALDHASRSLLRLRDLALQSANGTNGAGERQALQAEAAQIIDEVARLTQQTSYRGQRLLDGTAGTLEFQLGSSAGEQFRLEDMPDLGLHALGASTMQLDGSLMGTALPPAPGVLPFGFVPESDLVLKTAFGGQTAPFTLYAPGDSAGAQRFAKIINLAAGSTGITAAGVTRATLSNLSAPGTVRLLVGFTETPVQADILDPRDLTPLVDAFNATALSFRARFANPADKSAILLEESTGRTLQIKDFSNTAAGDQTIELAGERGTPVTLTEGGNDTSMVYGIVTLSSTKGPITALNSNPDTFDSTSSGTLASLSIETLTGARKALDILDGALGQLNGYRSKVGAWLNRLDMVANSLATGVSSLTAARGRVVDADFAVETASLVRSQVLQQAGSAMVAQANLQPRTVLSLLQG
jgi:flagellin